MNTEPGIDQPPTGEVIVEDQSSRLVSTYLIAGWAALIILLILSGLLYRRVATAHLIRQVKSQNTAFTSEFERLAWPELSEYVADVVPLSSRDDLQAHPMTERFKQLIAKQADGQPVVKVKLYTREGLTVFSTTPDDIGQYSDDIASLRGYPEFDGAKLAHYNSFEALGDTIKDCDLVSSYDAFPSNRYRPEGILEIYQDVTPSLQRIKRTQAIIIGTGVFLVTLLLGISILARSSK